MRLEPFRATDLQRFSNYGGQDWMAPTFEAESFGLVEKQGGAFSAEHEGQFLGVGGLLHHSDFRATAWCVLNRTDPKNFLLIHRVVSTHLNRQKYRRIDAIVDLEFEDGLRWVRLLGFVLEVTYKPFCMPDGRPASEWVRLR